MYDYTPLLGMLSSSAKRARDDIVGSGANGTELFSHD